MLSIQKKNSLSLITVTIIAAVTATLTTFAVLMLLNAWTHHLCGSVSLADYANNNAPAKCQELWRAGEL